MFSSVVFHGSRLLVWYWIRSREVNPGHDLGVNRTISRWFKQGSSIQFQTGLRTWATLIVPHLTWPEHTVHSVITCCVEEKERLLRTLRHTFKAGPAPCLPSLRVCARSEAPHHSLCTPQQFNKTSWLSEKYSGCVWTVNFQEGEWRQQGAPGRQLPRWHWREPSYRGRIWAFFLSE